MSGEIVSLVSTIYPEANPMVHAIANAVDAARPYTVLVASGASLLGTAKVYMQAQAAAVCSAARGKRVAFTMPAPAEEEDDMQEVRRDPVAEQRAQALKIAEGLSTQGVEAENHKLKAELADLRREKAVGDAKYKEAIAKVRELADSIRPRREKAVDDAKVKAAIAEAQEVDANARRQNEESAAIIAKAQEGLDNI